MLYSLDFDIWRPGQIALLEPGKWLRDGMGGLDFMISNPEQHLFGEQRHLVLHGKKNSQDSGDGQDQGAEPLSFKTECSRSLD